MTLATATTVADDALRARLDAALEKTIDDEAMRQIIAASLELKKQARGWCPNCRKQVQVEIDDAKAVVAAVSELVNQAKGRPGQADEVEADRVQFEQVYDWGCENCQCDDCRKDRGETTAA